MEGVSRSLISQIALVVVVGSAAGGIGGVLGNGGLALALGALVGVVGGFVLFVVAANRTAQMAQLQRLAEALADGSTDPGKLDLTGDEQIVETAQALMSAMGRLHGLRQQLDLAATGDLSRTTSAHGELAQSLIRMLSEQRSMVERIGRASQNVDKTSARMLGTSRQQEANAAEQAAVVEEILRTTQGVAENAARVSGRAEEVLKLAERTDGNNKEINERIALLASHGARIGEILERINEIAHKSEILALNASLEGTRAGEAGRGFSLVAGQMGQLSESVLAAVVDIQQLTQDIASATQAAVAAADEAAEGSAATARAAREIRAAVEQQTVGTQQVGRGLEEISTALHEASTAARSASDDAEALAQQSARLGELLAKFKL